ncbi:MAG: L28 family ribosomal protein [bacterium]|nr:L28 family ribosomal protein [bacterium]
MARCLRCGKRAVIGRQVSHSGIRSRKVFRANIHKFQGKAYCTKCLRIVKRELETKREKSRTKTPETSVATSVA